MIITSGDGDKDSLSNFPEISNDKIKLFTAVGTKGLEYDAVMLFNFSKDSAYKLFEKLLNGETLTASLNKPIFSSRDKTGDSPVVPDTTIASALLLI